MLTGNRHDKQFLDDSCMWNNDGCLHFHSFERHQQIAGLNALPLLRSERGNNAWHRRGNVGAVRQVSNSATAGPRDNSPASSYNQTTADAYSIACLKFLACACEYASSLPILRCTDANARAVPNEVDLVEEVDDVDPHS